jgi:hypothetical protein
MYDGCDGSDSSTAEILGHRAHEANHLNPLISVKNSGVATRGLTWHICKKTNLVREQKWRKLPVRISDACPRMMTYPNAPAR